MAVNQRRIEQEKLLQMQQQGIVPQTVKKKKKKEGMFEENAEDGGESPTKAQNLRLFVLPTTTELFELLKKAIASQKTAKYL